MEKKPRIPSRQLMAALVAQLHLVGKRPLSQTAIATQLGIDKATVSRLLALARDENLFSVILNLPREQELEVYLRTRYPLVDAVVFPLVTIGPDEGRASRSREQLAVAAARHLEAADFPVSSGQRIGISCGATMRDLVVGMTPGRFEKLELSQLTVETNCDAHIDQSPFALVSLLYAKWRKGSTAYAIQPLPGELCDEKGTLCERYESRRAEIVRRAEVLDVAIVGIGACKVGENSGSFGAALGNHGYTKKKLDALGVVGELCNRPFDQYGDEARDVFEKIKEDVDGVELSLLRRLVSKNKRVIAVACGANKVEAIRVALEHRLVNYLITDLETAEALCAEGTK